MSLPRAFRDYARRAEETLERVLPPGDEFPLRLHQAMRYSALNGGKRLRPCLAYTTGEVLNVPAEQLDGPAAALELIHAYSLVHDDLPAMDDDALRRGKPTCHKAYDEATAILVGDALQSLAFETLATETGMTASTDLRLRMVSALARASGEAGMVGGQALDWAATGTPQDLNQLESMHSLKTGALIRASVRLACLSRPDMPQTDAERLDRYGYNIGLAFQIQDDVLDEVSDTQTLGKTQGSDRVRKKSTFPALIGLDGAKDRARSLIDEALENLSPFGSGADNLRALARYIVERDH